MSKTVVVHLLGGPTTILKRSRAMNRPSGEVMRNLLQAFWSAGSVGVRFADHTLGGAMLADIEKQLGDLRQLQPY